MEARYNDGAWVVSHTEMRPHSIYPPSDDMPSPMDLLSENAQLRDEARQLDKTCNKLQRLFVWQALEKLNENVLYHEVMGWTAQRVMRALLFANARQVLDVSMQAISGGPVYGGTGALRPMFLGGNWAWNVKIIWTEDDVSRAACDDTRAMLPDAWIKLFGFPHNSVKSIEEFCESDAVYELYPYGIVVCSAPEGESIGLVQYVPDTAKEGEEE